ncbi:E3 ubiquitin-protein ligase MYCBP2 isoform X2 [Rhopalosiphum padi]|uniref:E3 ubiquitin-protein ligase MYCBP2 isoform X2 n=1 Tax=Rhopalosiphum padi TaxID=40932 RepID=UPI00298E36AC|nr:E3 ubiquitin-protein ligase MYCBP2 isoform X2 [Rhopalosiphum padi]
MLPEVDGIEQLYRRFFQEAQELPKKHHAKKNCQKAQKGSKLYKDGGWTMYVSGNASSFAVLSAARYAVFDRHAKKADEAYWNSSSAPICLKTLNRVLQSSNNVQAISCPEIFIPKVVGIGLRSVFELIKESRVPSPEICTKALMALLDIIQYQSPEALKDEPSEVIDPLYELLLDMATGNYENGTYDFKAVSCSCLISLVIVRGDTGKILNTLTTLIMCPNSASPRKIILPKVLTSLQKCVRVLTYGDYETPDWMSNGVPKSSEIITLNLNYLRNIKGMACDGDYLYTYSEYGFHKIGTGFGGTVSGHPYVNVARTSSHTLHSSDVCFGFYQKMLYLRVNYPNQTSNQEIEFLDRDTFKKLGRVQIDTSVTLNTSCKPVFSDKDRLCFLDQSANNYVIKSIDPSTGKLVNEVPLVLSRRNVRIYGVSELWDSITAESAINSASDEEVSSVATLKDCFIISVKSGKAFQWLKSNGQSSINCYRSVWSELSIPNPCKIIKVAAGHDGLHCVLLCDTGSAYFLGVSRRGEDCDNGRYRKQPRVLKPKRITKLDGQFIVDIACNNGTTALVTKDGLLYMFGKDDTYCDIHTGLVKDLKNAKIVQIALGKAHAIALSAKGHIYSFGINNKGQCGRDICAPQNNKNNYPEITNNESLNQISSVGEQSIFDDDCDDNKPCEDICKPGKHNWKHEVCMVCTVCGECTGYSYSCLSSIRSNRKSGQECGCGEGDAGCTICGCCRICAREVEDNSELALLGPNGAGDIAGMMRLDVIFGGGDKAIFGDRFKKRLNICGQRQKLNLVQIDSSMDADIDSSIQTANNTNIHFQTQNSIITRSSVDDAVNNPGSDIERDTARMTILPPARVFLPTDSPVIQISCGLHHTVLLLSNGKVITFGSNSNGQLGCSLSLSRKGPTVLKIPRLKHPIISVSAGSNHTALVSKDGKLYTFGSYLKSQLGRDSGCNHVPLSVEDINPPHTRRARVVMCCGNQTIVKVDEALINSKILSIAANNEIILVMTSNKCLAINKQDGTCNSYSGNNQIQFDEKHTGMWCFDLLYNNLWHISDISEKVVVTCYNVNSACRRHNDTSSLLNYELALPPTAGISVSRIQVLVNLLTCMDILAQNLSLFPIGIASSQSNIPVASNTVEPKKEFLHINRFASLGGGWGYSGHSVEAIRFSVDCNIALVGFGLFGGRGEYTVKLKVYDIGVEGGEREIDGELLAETDELTYECAPRQKNPVLLDEPIALFANRWYVGCARITGPSSDCGSSGMCSVTSDEQITFTFKSSRRSNNGTDINAGQIPEILYKTVIPDSLSISTIHTSNSDIHILSDAFSHTVNKECFNALITLLRWSWTTINKNISDMCLPYSQKNFYMDLSKKDTSSICELKRLMFISQSCFHLLRSYIHEIYPDQVDKMKLHETEALASCVVEVRQLLQKILSDVRPHEVLKNVDRIFIDNKGSEVVKIMKCIKWLNQILNECHMTFVSCYHAFYPTPHLKLYSLWELLMDKKNTDHKNKLLTAVVAALCNTTYRLRELMPILKSTKHNEKSGSLDQDHQYYYPLLVNATTSAAHNNLKSEPNWEILLTHLLDIISLPVRNAILNNKKPDNDLKSLSTNCSHLVARVVAELSSQAILSEDGTEIVNEREILLTTPSRFAKINQTKTWNAGNGSPDAICFWVDRAGITIAGCGVFAGVGNYEYELELLAEKKQLEFDEPHGNRWKSLLVTRGSFGPDDSAMNYVADLKFDHPIRIKERVKYAIRLRNYGGRTNNGDMGLSCVKGHDNTLFSFNTCSLSLNGTTQSRGQIPYILYYSHDKNCDFERKVCNKIKARESTLSLLKTVVEKSLELINMSVEKLRKDPLVYKYLGESAIVNVLLPLVLAHIGPLTSFSKDAKSAIHVLELINKLLPAVTSINLYSANKLDVTHKDLSDKLDGSKQLGKFKSSKTEIRDFKCTTTSHHYAWVESDHPYTAATVSNYKVKFPKEVKWLCLEFDPRSCTAQTEDSLQLYIPNYRDHSNDDNKHVVTTPYIPVLKKFSNDPMEWPFAAVMLPGNEVMFSLETASDYLKNDRISRYGFRCLVIGYEVEELSKYQALGYGLVHLETELSFLGGMCVSTLLKCDIILPNDDSTHSLELGSVAAADEMYAKHSGLLKKGFALEPFLNIQQVMDGVLPLSVDGNENRFLREFVACAPHSAGCRLARWLQPESVIEPDSCELSLSTAEVRCGWPAKFTVRTRDQYGNLVQSIGLKVEFFTQSNCKSKANPYIDICSGTVDDKYFGGHPVPKTYVPYEAVIKDKFRYQTITFMKHYENYSFEELRLASPSTKGDSEKLPMESQGNGTYIVYWTPLTTGYYDIRVEVDGYPLTKQTKHIDVKEAPFNGAKPPDHGLALSSPATKLLQHVGKYSAGLRIRTHPSLQSEQIGVIPVKGIIGYTDEMSNDDGDWVLLNSESVERHCQRSAPHIEAWCMRVNKYLNSEQFLVPVNGKTGGPKAPATADVDDDKRAAVAMPDTPKQPNRETAVKSSALLPPPPPPPPPLPTPQQPQPSPDHPAGQPVDYKVVVCGASGHNIRNQPTFKATPVGMLVQGNVVQAVDRVTNGEGVWIRLSDQCAAVHCGVSCVTAWSLAADTSHVIYLKPENDQKNERQDMRSFVQRIDNEVRDLKVTNRSNNANTQPQRFNSSLYVIEQLDTMDDNDLKIEKLEKQYSPKRKKDAKAIEGLNANPLPVPYHRPIGQDSRLSNGNMVMIPPSSPRKTAGNKYAVAKQQPYKNACKTDVTCSRKATYNHSLSASSDTTAPPTTSSSSVDTHMTSSLSTSVESSADQPEPMTKVEMCPGVAQAATQTTPENERVYSFEPSSKSKPKYVLRIRPNTKNELKTDSISSPELKDSQQEVIIQEPKQTVKMALSPSMAESLRAVFAAFLWHEGIVHDAMTCASFLKFYPSLPKNGAVVTKRMTERNKDRGLQRHSVEVTTGAGGYRHIRPNEVNRPKPGMALPAEGAITEESMTSSGNSELADSNHAQMQPAGGTDSDGRTTINFLPPALNCMVRLWDVIAADMLYIINSVGVIHTSSPNRRTADGVSKNSDSDSSRSAVDPTTHVHNERILRRLVPNYQAKEPMSCELCGDTFAVPVSYHMLTTHPGCGHSSGGHGYTSNGIYKTGWSGACGEGGIAWYLLCESCRGGYMKRAKPPQAPDYAPPPPSAASGSDPAARSRKTAAALHETLLYPYDDVKDENDSDESPVEVHIGFRRSYVPEQPKQLPGINCNDEVIDSLHVTFKENAMFLLDLASTSAGRPTGDEPPSTSGPWTVGEFKCLGNLEAPATCKQLLQSETCNNALLQQLRDCDSAGVSSPGIDVVDGTVTRSFHRSVSMDIEKSPLRRQEMINRRKRINSTIDPDNGLSMVCMPSAALQALVPSVDNAAMVGCSADGIISNNGDVAEINVFNRPSMAFVIEAHNLEDLKWAMKHAVRKAACRSYALQALNWLLHEVSRPSCLHDLLWWFVIALSAEVRTVDGTNDSTDPRCRHPLSDLYLAGESVKPLPQVFYQFLQTVSDLMLYLPAGSALQMMAVRCWDINFTASDHMFLHRSKVFSNISKILSHSEDYQDVCEDTQPGVSSNDSYVVSTLKDITENTEITATSRPAMVPNLIDRTTETFWESSEDDKNKFKTITIQCNHAFEEPKALYIHFDNCRDLNNKISTVVFSSGQTTEQLNKIQTIDVDTRFSGWLGVYIQDHSHKVLCIEVRGGDTSVRVRQVKVLGTVSGDSLPYGRQYNYSTIQHRQCENETLKVFRSITFQVFGKLIQGKETSMDSSVEESKDLKEHMVGILFSQSKLTHLQKQVCTHIVDAIQKEAVIMREEWEKSVCKTDTTSNNGMVTPTDSYCFEMLSMVSALSGSNAGRSYLANQYDLLSNLLSLLHTGSARVQRQVTLLFKRVLPEVSPSAFASLTGSRLPSTGFSIASPPSKNYQVGLLDSFLSVIAKALILQVKVKGANGSKVVNSLKLRDVDLDEDESLWFLKGDSNRKLADDIIRILWDLSNGKLRGKRNWIDTTRAAIAENILNLTRLSKEHRTMESCIKNPVLWLALASHCVLHPEHAERLSSGQWLKPEDSKPTPPRPLCSNHDDGETAASIQCLTCGNLCIDCDRILHLHRKTKHHQRQVCKEEEEAIRVDLHEGCGRTKLFWLLALADKATLQALVEFRDTTSGSSDLTAPVARANVLQLARVGVCRYCGMVSNDGLLAIGNVCANDECQLHAQTGCQRILKCGHLCGGIKGETKCLPCLHGCDSEENPSLKQDADDMCMICFTDALSAAPSIQLICGHVFHYQCCKRVLVNKWAGPRITFGFQQCPICKTPIDHACLAEVLDPIRELMADVKRKALMRLEYEGECTMKNDHAAVYAMEKYAYYVCFKCKKAYYGGEARCELDVGGTDYDPAELVCGGCSDVARAQMCPKHGTDLLEYKCRYCCSVAVFFCFGTTHFCNACHDDFQRVTNLLTDELPPCPAGPRATSLNVDECPLHVKHPPTGEEFALGCGVCRNAHTF